MSGIKHRSNLQRLATFLAYGDLPKDVRFDMEYFCQSDQRRYIEGVTAPPCGSAACAVGFAPFAGIRKYKKEEFAEYAKRVFMNTSSEAWYWCFDTDWRYIDNTPKGAAKRIQYFLDKGVPEDFYYLPTEKLKKLYARTKVRKPEEYQ